MIFMLFEIFEVFSRSFIFYFVVIDPLGTVAIFLSLLQSLRGNKYKIALEASFFAFLILVFFLLFGRPLLIYLNISIYSFKIAGGIILLIISLEMLLDKRSSRKEKIFQKNAVNSSLFPLAIPLLAGPAAITSVMVSSSNIKGNFLYSLTHIASLFTVLLITSLLFILFLKSEKYISKKLLQVFSRIIAVVLAALSIQFILDGLNEAISSF